MNTFKNKILDGNEEEKDEILKQGISQLQDQIWRKELEAKLNSEYSINRSTSEKRNTRISWYKSITSIAAIFLVLIISYTWWSTQNPEEIAQEYLNQPILHPGGTKGEDINQDQQRSQAIVAFNQQNYFESAALFSKIEHPSDQDKFYQALSYIHSSDYQSGIDLLEQLSTSDIYSQEAKWYLSLAWLVAGNTNKAIQNLQQINPNDWNYQQAQHILKKID